MEEAITACEWDSAFLLTFSDNVFASLIYYSHFFPMVISILLGVFLITQNKENNSSANILGITLLLFAFWVHWDLILWATESISLVVFFWSLLILFEPMIYAGLFLFLISYSKHHLPVRYIVFVGVLLLPTIILAPTSLAIESFDLTNCDREVVEGPLVYYGYFIEVILLLYTAIIGLRWYKSEKSSAKKAEIRHLVLSVILFMFAFAWGNIVGSISENWTLGQFGLLAMPIFALLLTWAMVKYRSFQTKIFGAQALVVGLWMLLVSILFVRTVDNVRIITIVTLFFAFIFGLFLIKSVKREIEQREKIEKLAQDLSHANDRLKELDQLKSEFLSFATHQIRSPLTAIRGYATMIDEGDFGRTTKKVGDAVDVIKKSAESLIVIVNEFLDISRIEQGRMKYNMETFDISGLVKEVSTELLPNITEKGLTLNTAIEGGECMVQGDKGKLKQIVGNLIDNAIKYTPQGAVTVSLSKAENSVLISITDSGVGIKPEEISKLFSKFGRTTDAFKTNVTGTGLGLYVAKQMLKEHGGEISVSSPGVGKGSTFTVTLPLISKQ